MRNLLHKFALGIWAFRPGTEAPYLPQVHAIISDPKAAAPTPLTEKEMMAEAELRFVTQDDRVIYPSAEEVRAEPGLVMVMNVRGAIMKDDWCGAPGTGTMARWLQEANDTAEVDGVVLDIDSPGGDGYAMFQLAQALERMQKPSVGIVNAGMACSAAYGIGAKCTKLLSGSGVDEFGSVGTYIQLRDWTKWEREKGITTHTIAATRSTQKLAAFKQALKADPDNPEDKHYETIRAQRIDPFNERFIAMVQAARPDAKDERGVFEGRVFLADEALELGLIDSTGHTLSDAIHMVRTLRNSSNQPTS